MATEVLSELKAWAEEQIQAFDRHIKKARKEFKANRANKQLPLCYNIHSMEMQRAAYVQMLLRVEMAEDTAEAKGKQMELPQ